MSTHELQQKLLEYVAHHYEIVKEMDEDEVYEYLEANYLHHGICHVIERLFKEEKEAHASWIWEQTKKAGRILFWEATPCEWNTKEQNLAALSTRIQILTELTNTHTINNNDYEKFN